MTLFVVSAFQDMEFSLYHQDLPAILVKYSLDKSDKDRSKISQLMHALSKENVITTLQMAQGFRKLYQNLDELALDAPNAKVIMTEFTNHAVAAGYLDSSVQSEVENDTAYLGDVETLKKVKKDIDECLQEYMSSNVIDELLESAKSVPPAMHFELVKRLVYVALDRTDVERERVSFLLLFSCVRTFICLWALTCGRVVVPSICTMFVRVPVCS